MPLKEETIKNIRENAKELVGEEGEEAADRLAQAMIKYHERCIKIIDKIEDEMIDTLRDTHPYNPAALIKIPEIARASLGEIVNTIQKSASNIHPHVRPLFLKGIILLIPEINRYIQAKKNILHPEERADD